MVYGNKFKALHRLQQTNPLMCYPENQLSGVHSKLRTATRAINRKAVYETRRHRKERAIAEHRDRKRRAGHWDGGWVMPFVCVCIACMVVFQSM